MLSQQSIPRDVTMKQTGASTHNKNNTEADNQAKIQGAKRCNTEVEDGGRDSVETVDYLDCSPEGGSCSHGCVCNRQRIQHHLHHHLVWTSAQTAHDNALMIACNTARGCTCKGVWHHLHSHQVRKLLPKPQRSYKTVHIVRICCSCVGVVE